MIRILIPLLFLALTSCSRQAALDRIASPEDQALGRAAIAELREGRKADLERRLRPELRPKIAPMIDRMRILLPARERAAVRLVDANFVQNLTRGGRRTNLIWEVSDGSRYALVLMTVARREKEAAIVALRVEPLPQPVDQLSGFDLAGKSFVHYLFLLLAAASAFTCLAALVLLFRTPNVRRRWLWAFGCLWGFGALSIQWSSGEILLFPLSVHLLGVHAMKTGLLAPWLIGASVPVFAILFLVKRREWAAAAEKPPVATSVPDA